MKTYWNFLFTICLYTRLTLSSTEAQEIQLIDINTNNFPLIEAILKNKDNESSLNNRFTASDFLITEKSESKEVLKVDNPILKDVPLSILLMLDISGSMANERFQTVSDAATNFIQNLSLVRTEIAIASFNKSVFLNCDFTHNKHALLNKLNQIEVSGGTDYNEAFLHDISGAIELSRTAANKKIIIFLTDGQSSIEKQKVIDQAKALAISVYTISVHLPIPQSLKDISKQTGGEYYEALIDDNEVRKIYSAIQGKIQSDMFAKIYWRTNFGCNQKREGILTYKGASIGFAYDVPKNKISYLEPSQTKLHFGKIEPGNSQTLTLDLKASGSPVELSGVNLQNKAFRLAETYNYPVVIYPDSTVKLSITFRPKELGAIKSSLTVSSKQCPNIIIPINGGVAEKIKLLSPAEGEILAAGNDALISWDGIRRSRKVSIYFRASDSLSWTPVSLGERESYTWSVPPGITNHTSQIRVHPAPQVTNRIKLKHQFKLPEFVLKDAAFSKDGSKVAVCSNKGSMFLFESETNTIIAKVRGFYNKGIHFTAHDKILSFDRQVTTLHGKFGGIIHSIHPNSRIILNSVTLSSGKVFTLPSSARNLRNGKTIVKSPFTEVTDTIHDTSPIRHAALSNDGTRILTLNSRNNIKLWETKNNSPIFSGTLPNLEGKFILNPNSTSYVSLQEPKRIEMFNLSSGELLFILDSLTWINYCYSGKHFIVRGKDSSLHVLNSKTGKQRFDLPRRTPFQITRCGDAIIYFMQDTLKSVNLSDSNCTGKLYAPQLNSFRVSPDDKKVLLLRNTGQHSILEAKTLKNITTFQTKESIAYLAFFSNNSDDILLQYDNHGFELWSPDYIVFDDDISKPFSILQPIIEMPDTIFLGDQSIFKSMEYILTNSIHNAGINAVEIKKIELQDQLTSAFSIVKGINSQNLEPEEYAEFELRFSPDLTGNHYAKLRCHTKTDTVDAIVHARAYKPSIQQVADYHQLGELRLNEFRDTILPALINSGSERLTLSDVWFADSTDSQFQIIGHMENIRLNISDTLFVKMRFSGKVGGRTSAILKVNFLETAEIEKTKVFGNVLAPRWHIIQSETINVDNNLGIHAEVKCIDLKSGDEIAPLGNNANGLYWFQGFPGRKYGLFANFDGYISTSKQIDFGKSLALDTIFAEIPLIRIKPGAAIVLNCIFFHTATAQLQESSRSELNQLAKMLKENPSITIEIQGHTDNIGTKSYNYKLAEARANAVLNYLGDKKISTKRLSIKSFGLDIPVESNETEEGRAKNRRVEVKIN